jgi:transposase
MGTLILTDSDQLRSDILTRLKGGELSGVRAALLLGLSVRQVRRLASAYALAGLASIPHGNRGRPPHNRLVPATIARIAELTGEGGPYHDFNVCHTQELLWEREGVEIGRSTLHKLLHPKAVGPVIVKQKVVVHRMRRLREAAKGMMVQVDGSPHDWLEGRAARFCLMGAIDDASGDVLHGHFRPNEDANGYLFMFRDIAVVHGLPVSYYHDKHTILRSPKKPTIADDLLGLPPMSHVQRVLYDLGIKSIAAHSPQAKGRIERLWNTFQDRLVKEMRLASVGNIEQANAFLPGFIKRYNVKFAREAASLRPAWRTLEAGFDLDYHFSMQDTRTVKEDHTVSVDGKTLQICAKSRSRNLAGQIITVRVNPENKLTLYDGRRPLKHTEVPAAAPRQKQAPRPRVVPGRTPTKPTDNAGTRGFLFAAV